MSILIAGGTGSFGQAFLQHLNEIRYNSKVRVYSRDEAKQVNLIHKFPNLQLEFIIGDVRDLDAYTTATQGIDTVIHAAALKHVPVGELFPEEALKTNTLGTLNCVRACKANRVKKAIYLSTDKAVYPINAYGMAKALGEKLMTSKASHDCSTVFCITRYGNVLGSRGSILPLVRQKVEQGAKLPITDFSMTRFLMSLKQAVALVSYAIDKGVDGQLFIQDVPSTDLRTLVDAYLRLHYNTTLDEYGYQIVGIRPGEKMHEVLATQEELSRATILSDKQLICVEPYRQNELYRGTFADPPHQVPTADLSSDREPQMNTEQVIACLKDAEV